MAPAPAMRCRLIATVLSLLFCGACRPAQDLDLVIRGGTVYDGSGAAPRRIDVGIRGDRIAALGDLSGRTAGTIIDAAGLAVAPGFIDADTTLGTTLVIDGDATSHVWQGVTTAILARDSAAYGLAPDGDPLAARVNLQRDWSGFAQFAARLETGGISVNVATLAPAAMIADPRGLEAELRAGAAGVFVAGFGGSDQAAMQRATALARQVVATGGAYATALHPGIGAVDIVAGLDAVARAAGLQSAILILNGDAALADNAIEAIAQALSQPGRVPTSIVVNPSRADAGRFLRAAGTMVGTGSPALHPDGAVAALAAPVAGRAFGRLFESAGTESGPLAAAIHSVSGLPAGRFGLDRRGELREGFYADVVLFDPVRFAVRQSGPDAPPEGLAWVIVNGVPTLGPSGHTGNRPGRPLRGSGGRPPAS